MQRAAIRPFRGPSRGFHVVRALRKTEAAFGLQLLEANPRGPPGPADVVVAVDAAGICGSDVHIYDWSGGYEFIVPAMPVTLGPVSA
jgi:threonine dehydrogenase-like Zn-dependent dehydrogenase